MSTLAGKAPIPPGSKEFITVLRAPNGNCYYVVDVQAVLLASPDPAACGIVIADLVQHVTNALHGKVGEGRLATRGEIFDRIVSVMTKELKTNEVEAKRVERGP